MAQKEFDKSEEATPHKLREARKKGQVAKSLEISHWVVLVSFSLLLLGFWDQITHQFNGLLKAIFNSAHQIVMNEMGMTKLFSITSTSLMQIMGPIILLLVVAAVLANIAQTKPIFSTHPIKPDFTRLNPAQGIKKLFNRKVLFELFKSTLKIVIFVVVVLVGMLTFLPSIIEVSFSNQQNFSENTLSVIFQAILFLQALLLPILAFDWIFSKRDFARQMRMSKREVKDEYKRNEGHPEIKSKRKEVQKELLKKSSSLGKVKDSDVVIVNPTHYAVALKYDMSSMVAPVVLAKGKGDFALKIREQARRYAKPVLRKPALARLIYGNSQIDSVIPLDAFNEVAQIYRWLLKEKQKPSTQVSQTMKLNET